MDVVGFSRPSANGRDLARSSRQVRSEVVELSRDGRMPGEHATSLGVADQTRTGWRRQDQDVAESADIQRQDVQGPPVRV